MGGALLVTMPAFRVILKRPRPILADGFDLPTKSAVDRRLLGGAALFGVGWGLSGFCPGPAVAALSTGLTPVLAFVAGCSREWPSTPGSSTIRAPARQ